MDFGRVLGRFWEAKILDFRTFFDVFSKHFFNIFFEGQKIEKKRPTRQQDTSILLILGRACGMSGLRGREEERGVSA